MHLILIVKSDIYTFCATCQMLKYYMGSKHLHKTEPKLQESLSQPSIPVEGLRILARIISRHLERKRQQSNSKANNTEKK